MEESLIPCLSSWAHIGRGLIYERDFESAIEGAYFLLGWGGGGALFPQFTLYNRADENRILLITLWGVFHPPLWFLEHSSKTTKEFP